jgi:tetratricopeptide (TPR) repeat protein
MKSGLIHICLATLLVAIFLSPAPVYGGDGSTKTAELERSIDRYKTQLEKSPGKADLWRKLGIAYFQLDRYDEALTALTKAGTLDPNDAPSVVYRGMIHEQKGQLDQAKNLYQAYLAFGKQDRLTQEVRYRLRWIEDNQLKQVVDQAVSNEKNVKITEIPKNSIAVVRFNVDSLSPQLKPLGRGLAELVYSDLAHVPELKLVERLELARLQDELNLNQSQFSDKFNAPRIGKIVGASKIITGQLTQLDGGHVGIDCGIIDVGPGLADYPGRQEGRLAEVFAMQKRLVLEIIQKLGYEVTASIKNQIDQSPTESFLALLAFSRGLDYADQGLYPLAEAEFKTAISEDPHFGMAQQQLDRYSGLSNYNGTLKPLGQVTSLVTQETTTDERKENNKGEIIGRLQDITGVVIPSGDVPYVAPQPSRGKVIITGRTDHP